MNKEWTKPEEKFLKEVFTNLYVHEIGNILNRKIMDIFTKADKLGISETVGSNISKILTRKDRLRSGKFILQKFQREHDIKQGNELNHLY